MFRLRPFDRRSQEPDKEIVITPGRIAEITEQTSLAERNPDGTVPPEHEQVIHPINLNNFNAEDWRGQELSKVLMAEAHRRRSAQFVPHSPVLAHASPQQPGLRY